MQTISAQTEMRYTTSETLPCAQMSRKKNESPTTGRHSFFRQKRDKTDQPKRLDELSVFLPKVGSTSPGMSVPILRVENRMRHFLRLHETKKTQDYKNQSKQKLTNVLMHASKDHQDFKHRDPLLPKKSNELLKINSLVLRIQTK